MAISGVDQSYLYRALETRVDQLLLYLYHPIAISTVLHFSPQRGPLQIAAILALTVAAAAASYYFIELRLAGGDVPRRRVQSLSYPGPVASSVAEKLPAHTPRAAA